jgi:hypothetical protein
MAEPYDKGLVVSLELTQSAAWGRVGGHGLTKRPFILSLDRAILVLFEECWDDERFENKPASEVDTVFRQSMCAYTR